MENKKETSLKFKKIPVIITGAVVLVLAIICAYCAYLISGYGSGSTNVIAKGVTVDHVDIGGMTVEEAIVAVTDKTDQLGEKTLELVMDDNRTTATFAEFTIDYKVEDAVKQAAEYGKTGNIFSRIARCFKISRGDANIIITPQVDEESVADYVLTYSQAIGTTVVENSYIIEDNKLKLTPGKSGVGIDKVAITKEITDILLSGESAQIGVSLVSIDPLPWDADAIYEDVCKGPTEPGYESRDGKGYIVQAKNGYKFEKSDLEALLKSSSGDEVLTLELEVLEPENTVLDETGLFPEVIGEFSSSLAGSTYNRKTNVATACNSVNGTILNPGETFSYNKTVGAVTAATGYLPATIFTSKGHESGIGGGICQLSSTLYCAALDANLEIVKRRNHMYIVGYVPYGQDATVYEGELDFRFKNNTNEPMKIYSQVVGGQCVVKLYGKAVDPGISVKIENITVGRTAPGTTVREDPSLPEGTVQVEEKGTIGLTVDTYKLIYKNGELLSREYLHRSVYKPINRIEVHGTKPPEDTPASTEPVIPPEQGNTDEGTIPEGEQPSSSEAPQTPPETSTPVVETPNEPENIYEGI